MWKSTSELRYRRRADAVTETTSRRWRGAPDLISTQIAAVPPCIVPRVLDEPVGRARGVRTVADGEDGVVHVLRVVAAHRRRVDAGLIISEIGRHIERYRNRPSGGQVVNKSPLVALGKVDGATGHSDTDTVGLRGRGRGRGIERALLALRFVRIGELRR